MFRKMSLIAVLLVAVPQVAAAGTVRFALTPSETSNSADGTFQVVDGQPTDDACHFRLSVTGLDPGASYLLVASGPNGYEWSVGFFADERGSGTTRGATERKILSADKVEIVDALTEAGVMIGSKR